MYQHPVRDEREFSDRGRRACEEIALQFKTNTKKFHSYYNPNLIFKIKVNQGVNENKFSEELRRAGIQVISPSPDKSGYWVVFSEDAELNEFKEKMEAHSSEDMYQYFWAIEGIEGIPIEEKLSDSLKGMPLRSGKFEPLDIEVWPLKHRNLMEFEKGLYLVVESNGGKVTDSFDTDSFTLIRVKADKNIADELVQMSEIAFIDRPPEIRLDRALNCSLDDISPTAQPPEGAPGILIIDSGILSGHPLLSDAVGDELLPFSKEKNNPLLTLSDDVGHGTEVAGIALYGDVYKCITTGNFDQRFWIFSSKVMHADANGKAVYDDDKLLESQIAETIEWIKKNYPECKIVNLSLGDPSKRMFKGRRQHNLACFIDDISKKSGLIFVISAGNTEGPYGTEYPSYLLHEGTDEYKIIDPASSALSLTIGALEINPLRSRLVGCQVFPAHDTRVGLGLNGMVKPDLVENGGGGLDTEGHLPTLNPKWLVEGRLFTICSGTSYCSAKVSHHAAALYSEYPDVGPNLIKALMLASASIPEDRPSPLCDIDINGSIDDCEKLMMIYGYGRPDIGKSLASDSNRVMLVGENTISLDAVHLYYFFLPEQFLECGMRELSVSLCYDPPTRKNRKDYLGVGMEFHLFKNIDPRAIAKKYSDISLDEDAEEVIPDDLRSYEIGLSPGLRVRNRGVHQKGIKTFIHTPSIETETPMTLAVICKNKWVDDDSYHQKYAIAVKVQHSSRVDLFSQIQVKNMVRISL